MGQGARARKVQRPSAPTVQQKPQTGWRSRWYVVIFESDTPAGRRFDLLLLGAIVLSVITVMLDSVASVHQRYGVLLKGLEWAFTLLFTLEYIARLLCVNRPLRYARSFFGVIDLLSILPTWLAIFFPQSRFLVDVRVLRLLRVFRILKLAQHLREASLLKQALVASRHKITVFLMVVIGLVTVLGTLMYVIEDEANGFTSIPKSIYWAIVTLTTVGYGDIAPKSPLGQALASLVMIIGYAILAVPTGIFSAELARAMSQPVEEEITSRSCPECLATGLDDEAVFCQFCAYRLPPLSSAPVDASG